MSYSSKFFHYALPSVGALLLVGLYFVVDGIFVAKGVGSNGLAAINLAVPFISVLSSITTMLAIGGATLASISLGERNIKQANVFFNTSITLILLIAILFLFLTFLFLKEIALFLGCSNILLQPTIDSDILHIAYACIGIYGTSFLFAACNIVYTTFFLATKETGTAVKIAILRSVILNSLCIFTAAGFFQNNGIWLGIVFAEFLVLLYLYYGRLLRKPFAKNV